MSGLKNLNRLNRAICVCAFMVVAVGLITVADAAGETPSLDWNVDPVIEENSVDGLLLGIGGNFTMYGFNSSLKLGYGLDSGDFRYQAGLGWQKLALSIKDWSTTPILGREGEMALLLKHATEHKETSIGISQPWSTDDEERGPQLGYFHSHTSYTFTGEFDLSLTFTGDLTIGLIADGAMFKSMSHQLKARWGGLHFSLSAGTSSNEAELPGYEFTRDMRGYDDPLKGHSFWQARLERRVKLLSAPIPLPSLPELPGDFPFYEQFDFLVEASAFAEVLSVQPNPTVVDVSASLVEQQDRLGWGVGVVLSIEQFDFEFRLDLFFNQDGKMSPLFG